MDFTQAILDPKCFNRPIKRPICKFSSSHGFFFSLGMCYSVLTKNRIASTIWVYILCIIVWIVKMFLCVLFVIFHFILSSKAHVFRGKITNWLVFSILHVRSWNVHFTLTERTLTLCIFVFAFFFCLFNSQLLSQNCGYAIARKHHDLFEKPLR